MLKARPRHATRAQAIYETAIMLPLFMVGVFGTLWAIRESALSERVQEGVRYAGLVTAQQNTFTEYSLYAMYSALDGGTLPPGTITCSADLGTSLTSVRSSFWQPAAPSTSACSAGTSLVAASTQNLMLQNQLISANSTSPVDRYLSSRVLGRTTTPLSAKQNFFRSPDVGTLVTCTSVGDEIKASLEGGADTTTPISAATLMPLNPVASSVFAGPLSCQTFSSPGPQQTWSPAPTDPPTKTPSPTASPTQTPVPTASPKPTATPTPTPVPTATAQPTATPVRTASPTPTPSPTPCNNGNGKGNGYGNCVTPSPSPTPVPTATPTPNPYGTPAGGAH